MPYFESNGTRISYTVDGEGPPILLVHGFASSCRGNWRETGWIDTLASRGRRVIGVDCRGHGESDRPHGVEHYSGGAMQRDLLGLLEHLGIDRTDYLGYSMGSWMVLPLLAEHGSRFGCAVLGGAGAPLPETRAMHQAILAAFEGGEPPSEVPPLDRTIARAFRAFAESTGNDLEALSGVLRSGVLSADMLNGLEECERPVLVIAGDNDTIAGDAPALSEAIPGSQLVHIAGTDHLSTLKTDIFRDSILAFLEKYGLA